MAASETQIINQINVNYDTMDKIKSELQVGNLPPFRRLELEKRLKFVWQSQEYWAKEYKRVTGHSIVLFSGYEIVGNPYEENQELAKARIQADNLKKLQTNAQNAIQTVHQEYQRIRLLLQDQYDISVKWQNALFSDMTRMGAGLSAKHPLIFKKQVEDKAWPLLMEAERLYNEGKYEKAYQKAAAAGRWVKWGFDCLGWWMSKLEAGSERAVAAIKVSAALATLVVAAPLELGVLGTMGLAALSEGSQQGTTLVLKGLDPGETVSENDLKEAALAVAVNAGSAGLGKGFGSLVAKGLASRVAAKILREPSEKAIAFISARIEQYVAANSQAIANKMLKLDKDPDWNWWYMIITPALGPIEMEMAKEPTLNKLLKDAKN